MHNRNLGAMARAELIDLQEQIKRELKRFRPYRIKERLTTCTSDICECREGGALHGPYLYATYRKGGVTKKAALGPKFSVAELRQNVPDRPRILDYLRIPDHVYQEMTIQDGVGYISYELDDPEFEARHGVSKGNNAMGMADKYWGSTDEWERYNSDALVWRDRLMIPVNRWASYGVGTLRGIAILEVLERDSYYMK